MSTKREVEREEMEESLLLPEKATPARKFNSYVWILVVVVLLVAGFFLWLLL